MAACEPIISTAKAHSVRPAGLSNGRPTVAKLSPSTPPVPAGKSPAAATCKRRSTHTATSVAPKPAARTAIQDGCGQRRSALAPSRSRNNTATASPTGSR